MITIRSPSDCRCLSQSDLDGLHFLYPVCDDLLPQQVSCTKTRRLSGWLRLVTVVGVPFVLAVRRSSCRLGWLGGVGC